SLRIHGLLHHKAGHDTLMLFETFERVWMFRGMAGIGEQVPLVHPSLGPCLSTPTIQIEHQKSVEAISRTSIEGKRLCFVASRSPQVSLITPRRASGTAVGPRDLDLRTFEPAAQHTEQKAATTERSPHRNDAQVYRQPTLSLTSFKNNFSQTTPLTPHRVPHFGTNRRHKLAP
ncbi:unnamed protein product, partial [Ectocarpus sp. 6 AP-2014]